MDITKKQYDQMIKKASPPSKVIRNVIYAFLIGGTICTIGQIVNMCYSFYIQNIEDVSSLTSMTMIFLGALLTGLNVYDDIAKYGGAGTLVPITGFANSIVLISATVIEAEIHLYFMVLGRSCLCILTQLAKIGT